MKITTKQIQNIIKEELDKLLYEEETDSKLKQVIAIAIDDKIISQHDEKIKQQILDLIKNTLPKIFGSLEDENSQKILIYAEEDPKQGLELLRSLYDKFTENEDKDIEKLEKYPLTGDDNDTKKQIIAVEIIKSKDLSGLKLRGVDLSGVKFDQMDLSATNLREANLSQAKFTGVSLEQSNLSRANLSGSYLYNTGLKGASMLYANLSGAELRAVDLEYTNLIQAVLSGADLRYAKLRYAVLRGAEYDDKTKWPEGFDPEAAGAIKKQE